MTKYSEVKRQKDHGQTELSNMLVKKNVISKEGTFTQLSRTAGKSKGKYLKIQNFLKTC